MISLHEPNVKNQLNDTSNKFNHEALKASALDCL